MMVDDEPLIRKVVKMEMNERAAEVESGDVDGTEMRRVEMVETFADGPSLMAALETLERPDYLLVDMEFQGEPTGGLMITRRVHERYPEVKIIIFSGRFDNPLPGEQHRERRVFDIGRVVMEALSLGANAFVSKNAVGGFSIENILRAIACLERGEQCYFNYPVMLTIKTARPPAASCRRRRSRTDRPRPQPGCQGSPRPAISAACPSPARPGRTPPPGN